MATPEVSSPNNAPVGSIELAETAVMKADGCTGTVSTTSVGSPMTRRDWWLGVIVLVAALVLHAALPRYEWRQTFSGSRGLIDGPDNWEAGAFREGRWVAAADWPVAGQGEASPTGGRAAPARRLAQDDIDAIVEALGGAIEPAPPR